MSFYMFRVVFFFFEQKTAYEMRISDWSSDVCSSDLGGQRIEEQQAARLQLALHQSHARRRSGEAAAHVVVDADVALEAVEAPGEALPIGRASCRERVCQYV